MTAWQYVRQIVRQSNSSFLWGMRMLPKVRRQALYAVYAFAREVDDIADGSGTLKEKRTALDRWRKEVDRIYGQCPEHPVGLALQEPVVRFKLPQSEFLYLIDGMEMDASSAVRIATVDELRLYCRRVAGSVGVLSVHVFGAGHPKGLEMAVELGQAFQLTNILRDILEDARLDRVYLPRELLLTHDVPDSPLSAMVSHPGIASVCQELTSLARTSYARAEALIKQLNWFFMRPPVIMKAIYEPLLERMDKRGWTSLDESVSFSGPEKIWRVLASILRRG